jgi:hypothetical protein
MQAPKQGVGTQRILLGGVGGVSPGAQPIGTCGVVCALASGFAVCGLLQLKVGLRMSRQDGFDGADGSIHKVSVSPKRERNWWKKPPQNLRRSDFCQQNIFFIR